jgi:hypothetical protein
MPPHEGDAEERFLCYPPELDRQVRSKGEDVVKPAMVCHKQLRPMAVDVFQALYLNPGPAQPQIIFGPANHAVMLEPAGTRNKAAQDRNRTPKRGTEAACDPTPGRKQFRFQLFHLKNLPRIPVFYFELNCAAFPLFAFQKK